MWHFWEKDHPEFSVKLTGNNNKHEHFFATNATKRLNVIIRLLDSPNCAENDGQMGNPLDEHEKMPCNKIRLLQLSLPRGFQVHRHVTACRIITETSGSTTVTDTSFQMTNFSCMSTNKKKNQKAQKYMLTHGVGVVKRVNVSWQVGRDQAGPMFGVKTVTCEYSWHSSETHSHKTSSSVWEKEVKRRLGSTS